VGRSVTTSEGVRDLPVIGGKTRPTSWRDASHDVVLSRIVDSGRRARC
jgi:hypothetical protein